MLEEVKGMDELRLKLFTLPPGTKGVLFIPQESNPMDFVDVVLQERVMVQIVRVSDVAAVKFEGGNSELGVDETGC